jgi:hypothetical protein
MKKLVLVTLSVCISALLFAADEPARESKASDRAQAAADILNEIQSAPDSGIPREILSRADCVDSLWVASTVAGWPVAALPMAGALRPSLR